MTNTIRAYHFPLPMFHRQKPLYKPSEIIRSMGRNEAAAAHSRKFQPRASKSIFPGTELSKKKMLLADIKVFCFSFSVSVSFSFLLLTEVTSNENRRRRRRLSLYRYVDIVDDNVFINGRTFGKNAHMYKYNLDFFREWQHFAPKEAHQFNNSIKLQYNCQYRSRTAVDILLLSAVCRRCSQRNTTESESEDFFFRDCLSLFKTYDVVHRN